MVITMANQKVTKVQMFKSFIEKFDLNETELAFINHEIELIEKKNANRKPTKAQEENELIKEKIMELMADGVSRTVSDIQKAVGIETNQKASALVRQLRECDLLTRQEVKGKAWFTKA